MQAPLIFLAIYVIALGTGGIKPNVRQSPTCLAIILAVLSMSIDKAFRAMSLCVVVQVSTYGAEQFDPAKPQDRKELESFFNWFYW